MVRSPGLPGGQSLPVSNVSRVSTPNCHSLCQNSKVAVSTTHKGRYNIRNLFKIPFLQSTCRYIYFGENAWKSSMLKRWNKSPERTLSWRREQYIPKRYLFHRREKRGNKVSFAKDSNLKEITIFFCDGVLTSDVESEIEGGAEVLKLRASVSHRKHLPLGWLYNILTALHIKFNSNLVLNVWTRLVNNKHVMSTYNIYSCSEKFI